MIDAHLHLWDLDRLQYPWLDTVPDIKRTFLLKDYDEARAGRPVDAMVFVQAECRPDQALDELRWIQDIGARDARLAGIVPFAPIERGDAVRPYLEELAQDPRVKGVRRIIQFEDDPRFCVRPDFVLGVRHLGEVGLHFELTIDPQQFELVTRLVDACPGTRFILDHIGNPDIADDALEPWRSALQTFAATGPHRCKLSNLVCNADLGSWSVDDLRPYFDVVMEAFGPERVMWGSDWPHSLRASSWVRWLEAAEVLTASLGVGDQRRIFHDNAADFYRLRGIAPSSVANEGDGEGVP